MIKKDILSSIFGIILTLSAIIFIIFSKNPLIEIKIPEQPIKVINLTNEQHQPPCKLSIWIRRFDGNGSAKDNFISKSGVPMFEEFLLDGKFCDNLGIEKSQTTYVFENGDIFLELYKLPWTTSDNFDGKSKNKPIETFNLEKYKSNQ